MRPYLHQQIESAKHGRGFADSRFWQNLKNADQRNHGFADTQIRCPTFFLLNPSVLSSLRLKLLGARHIFKNWKISRSLRDLIKDTLLRDRKRKQPAPGGIRTHDLLSFCSQSMLSTAVLQPLPGLSVLTNERKARSGDPGKNPHLIKRAKDNWPSSDGNRYPIPKQMTPPTNYRNL